jgi:hypothetical protein
MIFFPDLFLYLIIDHRAPEPKQMPETNKVHKKDPKTFCSKDFLALFVWFPIQIQNQSWRFTWSKVPFTSFCDSQSDANQCWQLPPLSSFFFCLEHNKIEAQTEILGQLNTHSSVTWQTREMINSCILFKIASSHFIFNAFIDFFNLFFQANFLSFLWSSFINQHRCSNFWIVFQILWWQCTLFENKLRRWEISSNKNFK